MRRLKAPIILLIDDTLDVWAAHGMGGLTGAMLTGIFAEKAVNSLGNNGLLFGNSNQILIQLLMEKQDTVFKKPANPRGREFSREGIIYSRYQ